MVRPIRHINEAVEPLLHSIGPLFLGLLWLQHSLTSRRYRRADGHIDPSHLQTGKRDGVALPKAVRLIAPVKGSKPNRVKLQIPSGDYRTLHTLPDFFGRQPFREVTGSSIVWTAS